MQYNAIMLVRILIDNPGHTFARNLDAKFTSTVKDLLRQGRDMNAQQFLRETLEFMETQRSWDEDLATLVAMWKKEKERYNKARTFLVSDSFSLDIAMLLIVIGYRIFIARTVAVTVAVAAAKPESLWCTSSRSWDDSTPAR